MVRKFFLALLLFFSLLAVVNAVDCGVGECHVVELDQCIQAGQVYGAKFCSADGNLEDQADIGSSCLNDYECVNLRCIEGKCQDEHQLPNLGKKSLWQKIIDFFTGSGCDDDSDCDAGQVCTNGECVDRNDNRNGGSGTCHPNWNCSAWSNAAESCGVRTCNDLNNCGEEFTGLLSVDCPGPVDDHYCGDEYCDAD